MDVGLHEVAQGRVDGTMAGQGQLTGKAGGNDAQAEVAAGCGTGMTGVALGFIGEVDCERCQHGQALLDFGDDGCAQGRTFLKGLTSTRA